MAAPARQNLYRKYRPRRFSELAGQEHISKTIQSAVAFNRVNHAYMFSGPRGTGKTSSARLLAKILNCTNLQKDASGLPDCCGVCDNCRRIEEMNFMDITEIDAASNNGVEDIRRMRETVNYKPAEGKYKIYIIDEVHMLSGSAFNAFLKTLEEPPANVIFVLATTDPQKVPATIISRCQCFDFHSVSRKTIQKRLREIVDIESSENDFPAFDDEALSLIAEYAEGGFRDALSLLDQISSSASDGKVTADTVLNMTGRLGYKTLKEIAEAIIKKDTASVIRQVNQLFVRGCEPMTAAADLLEYFRRSMILKIDPNANQILDLPEEQVGEIIKQSTSVTHKYLITAVSRLERILNSLRTSFRAGILLESELIRLSCGEDIYTAEAVEKRVEALEQKVAVLKRLGGMGCSSPAAISPNRTSSTASSVPSYSHSTNYQRSGQQNTAASAKPAVHPTVHGNVSTVQTPFDAFKKAVMERSGICGAFLTAARFKQPENGVLTIGLEQNFAYDKLMETNHLTVLNETASKIFPGVSSVKLVKINKDSAAEVSFQKDQSKAAPKTDSSDYEERIKNIDEQVKKQILSKKVFADAVDIFGGDVVDIIKN